MSNNDNSMKLKQFLKANKDAKLQVNYLNWICPLNHKSFSSLQARIWSVIFGELQVRRSEHTDRFISFVFIYTFVLLSPGIGNSSPVLSDAPRCPDFECLDRELHGRLGHQWLWSGQSWWSPPSNTILEPGLDRHR